MKRPPRSLLAIAFVAFVSLGLPDGVLGVAWPSIRDKLRVDLTGLGMLLAAAVAGTLVSSVSSGRLLTRHGVGWVLVWSSVLMCASSAIFALGPAWTLLVVAAVIAGLGSGAIDAGINAYAAARFAPSQVNWLHACYGIGAMLGPVIMTSVLAAGQSWRWGYAILAVNLGLMTLCFAATRWLWQPTTSPKGDDEDPRRGMLEMLRQPLLRRHLALFFVYTGLEATAGQWSYTVMTEGRGIIPELAGTGVALYWGSLTAGRLVFGALALRYAPTVLLRLAMSGAPLAALVFAIAPGPTVSLASLGLLGFLFAPVYPFLMSLTPERVGHSIAHTAIGFQVSAAYLGVAILPAAAGALARLGGLEVLGFILIAEALLLVALQEVAWPGRSDARKSAPAFPVAAALSACESAE